MKISGFLLNIDYSSEDITLWIKTKTGTVRITDTYDPYFYLDAPQNVIKDIELFKILYNGEPIQIKNYEKIRYWVKGKEKELFKIYCYSPSHIPLIKKALEDFQCYEYKIRFIQRYLIDKQLWPLKSYEFIYSNKIDKIVPIDEEENFNILAFDIETYNPSGIPNEKKDPIIMISYADQKEAKVLTFKKINREFVITYTNEEKMLESFCNILEEKDIDLILGYNINQFDLPYLRKRARVLGLDLTLGKENLEILVKKNGSNTKIEIPGRIPVDLYPVARFLSNIGAVRITRFTLKRVYHELIGEKSETKELVKKEDIWKMWNNERERDILADYSLGDSKAVIEISKHLLPVEIELAKVCGLTLEETASSATGRLVESLLMRKAHERNEIIPEIPRHHEVLERQRNPIKAAYVKIPEPGIYINIAVFDFRSLYPSIIISHNIDPFTLNCDCCENTHVSPLGHKFCKKRKGIIPETLEELITKRIKLKKEMKKLTKDSEEYNKIFARQWALKILANSFYGQTVYPRARWYSRECGSSITSWGRHYILSTIEKAEKLGFDVLYSDTDSILLILKNKTKKEALEFMESINKELPGNMELELEDFYPRGVFVSKRTSATGAKKKYALIDEKGMIKIRGFELVRRDWSKIAKKTQMDILKAILQDGDKEKAVKIVKQTIQELKEGKIPLEDLVIYTQLQKNIHSYAIKSPEVSAAKKAIKRGKKIESGALVGYIITKNGSSISDKAELLEFAEDYDPEYYINKQIMPAVLKILKELGYEEDELKAKGKQIGLDSFF
ncbi:DNA-directed DNA polymerase [Candidatus Micrarchaeota archaeon]|nr:DNA-directed DNA polymerase [Candidatus Micrarchaeota archaeon]